MEVRARILALRFPPPPPGAGGGHGTTRRVILRDPVHGLVAFDSAESSIVQRLLDTRELQRLRRVRQLGLTSLAFPGAEHTRFAHAVGAAHVMALLLARLRTLDGDLPFWQRVTSDRARDAMAAALLHDVGHGPFSHLYETALPDADHHETWTERILLDPSTDVHRVLADDDPHLPRRVAELIHGRGDVPYLARAVSGTFDVDRCDYLLRDAHATGVRYGDFDLPWLLRALRFEPIRPDGAEPPGLALDGSKGLTAIESFVLARCFMFQQIYFHKTTRAAEHMIRAVFRRVVTLLQEGVRLTAVPPALAAAAVGNRPSVHDYLELDDVAVLASLQAWESAPDPLLADLSKRLRARRLFKTIELASSDLGEAEAASRHEQAEGAFERAREVAASAGVDPSLVSLDVAEDVPYDDESISVVLSDGVARRPSEVSFLLARLRGAVLQRTRLVFPPELREPLQRVCSP
jgi:HD superfamily phosphohydrolase